MGKLSGGCRLKPRAVSGVLSVRLDSGSALTTHIFKGLWNSKTGGLGIKRILLHEGNSPKVADQKRDGDMGQINCVNTFMRNKYCFF